MSKFFFAQVGAAWLVDLSAQSYYSINQAFAGHLSLNYLTAFSVISFLSIFYIVAGEAIGESVIIILSLDFRPNRRKRVISGSLLSFLLFGLPLSILLYFSSDLFLKFFDMSEVPGAKESFQINIAISFLQGINVYFQYLLSVTDQRSKSLYWNVLAILTNIIGCVLTLWFFDDPKIKMIFINFSFLLGSAVFAINGVLHFRSQISLNIRRCFWYLTRAQEILIGESLITAVFVSMPLLYTLILEKGAGAESAAAYGVGFRFLTILNAPVFAAAMVGVPWLASVANMKNRSDWIYRSRQIFFASLLTAGLPLLLFLPFLKTVLFTVFGLKDWSSTIIVAATLISALPFILTNHLTSQVRVFERQKVLALGHLLFIFGISIPLTYLLLNHFGILVAAIFGMVLPYAIGGAIFVFFQKKLVFPQRKDNRLKLPLYPEVRAFLRPTNKILPVYQFRLYDISEHGCGLVTDKNITNLNLQKGAKISVTIQLLGGELIDFDATLRSLRKSKTSIGLKEELFVGVELLEPNSELLSSVENFVKKPIIRD